MGLYDGNAYYLPSGRGGTSDKMHEDDVWAYTGGGSRQKWPCSETNDIKATVYPADDGLPKSVLSSPVQVVNVIIH